MKSSNSRKALGLLRVYDTVMTELRETGILRSNNNPLADFAEYMFAEAFDWKLTPKSTKGHDATDSRGTRFEIKARRLTGQNGSRQLSAIRDLDGQHFDFLAGVLFYSNFSICKAALIPWKIVSERANFVASTNSSKFILTDAVWELDGVDDVTGDLISLLKVGSQP